MKQQMKSPSFFENFEEHDKDREFLIRQDIRAYFFENDIALCDTSDSATLREYLDGIHRDFLHQGAPIPTVHLNKLMEFAGLNDNPTPDDGKRAWEEAPDWKKNHVITAYNHIRQSRELVERAENN